MKNDDKKVKILYNKTFILIKFFFLLNDLYLCNLINCMILNIIDP